MQTVCGKNMEIWNNKSKRSILKQIDFRENTYHFPNGLQYNIITLKIIDVR